MGEESSQGMTIDEQVKQVAFLASQQVKEVSSNTVGYPVSGQFLHKR